MSEHDFFTFLTKNLQRIGDMYVLPDRIFLISAGEARGGNRTLPPQPDATVLCPCQSNEEYLSSSAVTACKGQTKSGARHQQKHRQVHPQRVRGGPCLYPQQRVRTCLFIFIMGNQEEPFYIGNRQRAGPYLYW